MNDIDQLIERIHTANAAQRSSEHKDIKPNRYWAYIAATVAVMAILIMIPKGRSENYAQSKTSMGIKVYTAPGTEADQVVEDLEKVISVL